MFTFIMIMSLRSSLFSLEELPHDARVTSASPASHLLEAGLMHLLVDLRESGESSEL